MKDLLLIIIGTALVNNLILVQLLGVSTLFSSTNRLTNAAAIGLFSSVILVASTVTNSVIFKFILIPAGLEFMHLLLFLMVNALLTILLLTVVEHYFPQSYRRLRLAFFMVGTNSALIGLTLNLTDTSLNLVETLAYSIGAAIGFALVLILFAAVRDRTELAEVPLPFRGVAIDIVCAGLAAMAFLGFAGVV